MLVTDNEETPQPLPDNLNAPLSPGLPTGLLEELKANFNSLLYLLTEQMAVNIEIVQLLKNKNLIDSEEINQIFSVTGNKEKLVEVYNAIFTRFVGYFTKVREMLEENPTPPSDNIFPSAPPGENSAKEEEPSND